MNICDKYKILIDGMKHRINWLFVTIMVMAAVGCFQHSKNRQKEFIDLDNPQSVSFYDIFSRIDLIPLETSEESILNFSTGAPEKMMLSENRFYFLEKEGVLIFDADGKFINKIHKLGKGPGEYLLLSDCNVNRYTGNVELLSAMGYVNVYDSLGKEFKKTFRLPDEVLAVDYFVNLTPQTYAFLSNSRSGNKMLIFSEKENKLIQDTYKLPDWLLRKTTLKHNRSPFYIYDDTVCFTQVYDGKVFNLSPEPPYLSSRYALNFDDKTLDLSVVPPDKEIDFYMNFVRNLKSKYAIQFFIYAENSRYYFTRFTYRNRPHHLILDKQNNSFLLFEKFKEGFQCFPLCIDEKAVYCCASKNFLNFVLVPEVLDKENLEKYENIKEDDNPIIVKYTFKYEH